MNSTVTDVIVIGAGHAGLSISYHLNELHLDHIVFERGLIGDTWRNQRWDSFRMNTANKVNLLPGQENDYLDPDGFCTAQNFISVLEKYSASFKLPVIEKCEVLSVEKASDSKFSVTVSEGGFDKIYRCNQVVVASGGQNKNLIPAFSKNIPPQFLQLKTDNYRNSSLLPDGAVLIIGSGQSGTQIAEDLIDSGKKVFLSTSNVPRIPRRYRDKDIIDWLILTGFFDLQTSQVPDPKILLSRQPQISASGERGHTLSLQALSRKGVIILGKAENVVDDIFFFKSDAAEHVRFADEFSLKVKNMVNEYIRKTQLSAPSPDADPGDVPDETASCASEITSMNLKANNISSIIWSTGFNGDFSYLKLPVFNESGNLKHSGGISTIEGLYFLGLPWLRKRKSGIVLGIKEDAQYISEMLQNQKRRLV